MEIIETAIHRDLFNFFLQISACNLDAPICLRTAQDIFDQYDFSEDNFSIDFYALLILYVVFNVFAFLILWLRARKN